MDDSVDKHKPALAIAFQFFVEMLVGAILFTAVAVLAASLNFLVDEFKAHGFDTFLALGLTGAEYLVFICDLLLYARFVLVTTLKVWKAIS